MICSVAWVTSLGAFCIASRMRTSARRLEEARKASDGQVVVMGHCFGGAAALELARAGKAGGVSGYASLHGAPRLRRAKPILPTRRRSS
jgi:dienelactone hydrolase